MPRVPSKWSSFYVHPDDPLDPASALCCVVSAGVYLGSLVKDEHVALRVIERLDYSIAFNETSEKAARALADAAGLHLWRPNKTAKGLGDLAWHLTRPGSEARQSLWMALLKATFSDPTKAAGNFVGLHYVLVLEVMTAGVVVADPHPWNRPLSVISSERFISIWEGARGPTRKAWAGCLAKL
jgi:hypothetical protein